MEQKQYTTVPELNEFAELLKANGYVIIVPEKPGTWMHFAKDDKIGYVQKAYFGLFSFSTVHKPCREYGTGFGLTGSDGVELTLERAEEARLASGTVPRGFRIERGYVHGVKQNIYPTAWKSVEEYLANGMNQILKPYIA